MSQELIPNEKPDERMNGTEDEGDDDALQIFSVMHDSIDALEDRFVKFIDNPTKDEHKEFDDLVKDFITLARDLKNMAKTILPASDKKTKLSVQTDIQVAPIEETQPKKKGKKKSTATP